MATKSAYLTIDDCPSPRLREKLDYLLERAIPAILFCQGEYLEARPDVARFAISKGFVVGNHSYDHPYFSTLNPATSREQIERTDRIIDELYRGAGVRRPARYFRFPFGDKGDRTAKDGTRDRLKRRQSNQRILGELGYVRPQFESVTYTTFNADQGFAEHDWEWTYDVLEWKFAREAPGNEGTMLAKVLERMDSTMSAEAIGLNSSTSNEVILIHDHPGTEELFKPAVERLLAKGVKFLPVV